MKKIVLIGLLSVLLLVGCNTDDSTPTATYAGPTSLPGLIASPTTNPVAPVAEGPEISNPAPGMPGVSNPTQAGLAAEGQPDQVQPTFTPRPTQAALPMLISVGNGAVLQATFYGPALRPAPGVLLIHMLGRDRTTWDALVVQLQSAGYAILTIDLRGHGATGGTTDWTLAPDDVRAALHQLAELSSVDQTRLVVIGASIGANLGLTACADQTGCGGAALLSPGLDYHGITTADAIARMGVRPVLIVASENDHNNPADSLMLDSLAQGEHRLVIYPAAGHGTDMFMAEPGLLDLIMEWVQVRFPPE